MPQIFRNNFYFYKCILIWGTSQTTESNGVYCTSKNDSKGVPCALKNTRLGVLTNRQYVTRFEVERLKWSFLVELNNLCKSGILLALSSSSFSLIFLIHTLLLTAFYNTISVFLLQNWIQCVVWHLMSLQLCVINCLHLVAFLCKYSVCIWNMQDESQPSRGY